MKKNEKIKRVGEDFIELYDDIKSAAKSIDTRMDDWKVQLLICDAIVNKKRTFKCKWSKVEVQ